MLWSFFFLDTSLLIFSSLLKHAIRSYLMHEAAEHKVKQELGISGAVVFCFQYDKKAVTASLCHFPPLPVPPCFVCLCLLADKMHAVAARCEP